MEAIKVSGAELSQRHWQHVTNITLGIARQNRMLWTLKRTVEGHSWISSTMATTAASGIYTEDTGSEQSESETEEDWDVWHKPKVAPESGRSDMRNPYINHEKRDKACCTSKGCKHDHEGVDWQHLSRIFNSGTDSAKHKHDSKSIPLLAKRIVEVTSEFSPLEIKFLLTSIKSAIELQ